MLTPERISELQNGFVAGIVRRAKLPETMQIKQRPFPRPEMPRVVGGVRACPTKPTFGMVRVSKFPKHFAGMDSAGFMT